MSKSRWGRYSKEQFREALKTSVSVADCLRKLKLAVRPGNYRTFWKRVRELDLDTSHLQGRRLISKSRRGRIRTL